MCLFLVFNWLFFLPSSSFISRMNWPVRTAEAPRPVLQTTNQMSPKVELQCLLKLEDLLRTVPLNQIPPHPHAHYFLMMARPPAPVPCPVMRVDLLLLHRCLQLLQMWPWSLWTLLCRNRRLQTGSTGTWTGAAESRRAIRTSQRCRKGSRVSVDMAVRSLLLHRSKVKVSTATPWISGYAIKTFCTSLLLLSTYLKLRSSFLLVVLDGADNLEKSEVQAIIESTPELDMDLDGCIGTRYVTGG